MENSSFDGSKMAAKQGLTYVHIKLKNSSLTTPGRCICPGDEKGKEKYCAVLCLGKEFRKTMQRAQRFI